MDFVGAFVNDGTDDMLELEWPISGYLDIHFFKPKRALQADVASSSTHTLNEPLTDTLHPKYLKEESISIGIPLYVHFSLVLSFPPFLNTTILVLLVFTVKPHLLQ